MRNLLEKLKATKSRDHYGKYRSGHDPGGGEQVF